MRPGLPLISNVIKTPVQPLLNLSADNIDQLPPGLSKRAFKGDFKSLKCITQTALVVRFAHEPGLP